MFLPQLPKHRIIVIGVDQHGYLAVVFGGGAQHGRAADVDVFDGLLQFAAGLRHGFLERVKIDHHQADGRNAVGVHNLLINPSPSQNGAVDFRVQGLYPAIHDFREFRIIRYCRDIYIIFHKLAGGPAGRQDFNLKVGQTTAQAHDSPFVGNTNQSPGDRIRFHRQFIGNLSAIYRIEGGRNCDPDQSGSEIQSESPYKSSFLRSVLRLMPSTLEALL